MSAPIGAPLTCKHCGWHLVTLAAWRSLPPLRQGYLLYMQAAWPGSELADATNPHPIGTPAHVDFVHGQRRAMLDVQDGEE